jgi:hypothetical protein
MPGRRKYLQPCASCGKRTKGRWPEGEIKDGIPICDKFDCRKNLICWKHFFIKKCEGEISELKLSKFEKRYFPFKYNEDRRKKAVDSRKAQRREISAEKVKAGLMKPYRGRTVIYRKVYVTKEQSEALNKYNKETGIGFSEIMRTALAEFFKKIEEEKKKKS